LGKPFLFIIIRIFVEKNNSMENDNLFYAAEYSFGNEYVELPEQEAYHCIKVLRKKQGDSVHITNGKGLIALANIHSLTKKEVQLKIDDVVFNLQKRADYYLHLYVAPTKNINRFEFFLEKATEIGIDEITPIICEHSERRNIRYDRLEKIILAAAKQSFAAFIPKLNESIELKQLLTDKGNFKDAFLASCAEKSTNLVTAADKKNEIAVFIGPEGDFSKEETDLAKQKNIIPVSLGKNRLRTETAAIVATHTISLLNTK
jgi:16S rRNA (uracil1498-N3)-methyltransferase